MTVHHYIISGVDLTREPFLKEEFKRCGLNEKDITWMKGNNKDDLSDKLIDMICTNKKLKKGQIACTFKHYLALKDMVEKQRLYAVIMEDDVEFTDNIPKKLQRYYYEISWNYPDWNILFDGDINTYYGEECEYKEKTITKKKVIYPKSNKDKSYCDGLAGSTRGANYYLINLKTAKILLRHFLPFNNVVDHHYNKLFRKLEFEIYWSIPPFVHKMKRKSTLQYDD